jgi:hypothetical protein
MRLKLATGVFIVTALCFAVPARAQLNGENLLGDMGVRSGSQPDPGFYASFIYYRYDASSLKGPDGQKLALDPSGNASQTINAAVPLFYYVTPKKVLGANFGMMAVVPTAAGALEAPGFGLEEKASFGLSDLYVMPAQLGWHVKRADITTGFAFFAPTGRYSAGASDNLGKGMWSYELSGGGTAYFDAARSISVSTMAYWETHTAKSGEVRVGAVSLDNVKVGDLLTLEGGVGKSFLRGAASVGAAYYAQWKVTPDDLGLSISRLEAPEHRVWAIGPDVTIPIATKSRLISLVNVRYLLEQGGRMKTQGNTLLITNTIPIGGIKISR